MLPHKLMNLTVHLFSLKLKLLLTVRKESCKSPDFDESSPFFVLRNVSIYHYLLLVTSCDLNNQFQFLFQTLLLLQFCKNISKRVFS